MIEVTITEIALFGWAMVATLYAFRFKTERDMAAKMMMRFIEDEGVRNEVLKKYKEWEAAQERA